MLRVCNEKGRGTRILGKIAKDVGSAFSRIFGSEKEKKRKTKTSESQGRVNKEKAKEESKENMDGEVEQKKSRVDVKTLMWRNRNEISPPPEGCKPAMKLMLRGKDIQPLDQD